MKENITMKKLNKEQTFLTIKQQILTHNPEYVAEIYYALGANKQALEKINDVYYEMVLHNNNEKDSYIQDYKNQLYSLINNNQNIPHIDLTTKLTDTFHAINMSSHETLLYCHQSFWLHIKNHIQTFHYHDYQDIFNNEKAQYLFEDWLIEVDEDLNHIHQTKELLTIISDIKEMINFSNNHHILSLILSIEAECYEQLGQETQCDYFYQQNIKKEPHDPQLYLGYLLTLFDRYHHHISQFYQNSPFHHLDNSPSKYEIIDFMEEQ